MFKITVAIVFLILTFDVSGYELDLSSLILVEQNDGNWLLQAKSPLTTLQYIVTNEYGINAYDSPEEFQNLVSEHLKKNLLIEFDSEVPANYSQAQVMLGKETNVFFLLTNVPKSFSIVKVRNTSFKGIPQNQSALIILKKGMNQEQFALNDGNKHQVHLQIQESGFIHFKENKSAIPKKYWAFGFLGFVFIVFIFFWLKSQSRSSSAFSF